MRLSAKRRRKSRAHHPSQHNTLLLSSLLQLFFKLPSYRHGAELGKVLHDFCLRLAKGHTTDKDFLLARNGVRVGRLRGTNVGHENNAARGAKSEAGARQRLTGVYCGLGRLGAWLVAGGGGGAAPARLGGGGGPPDGLAAGAGARFGCSAALGEAELEGLVKPSSSSLRLLSS